MKRSLILLFLLPTLLFAQRDWANLEIDVKELAPGLHRLFLGNSVAVVVMTGTDGVLVVDAAWEQSTDRLLEEIRKLSAQPIKYLINTHLHGDHTGGNKVIGKDARIIAHRSVRDFLSHEQRRGEIVTPPLPEYALPQIFVDDFTMLRFNEDEIKLTHLGGGHTTGDVIVFFPKANVLVLGDLLFAGFFPFVDTSNGGNPLTYIENLRKILQTYTTNPKLVGGHGPVFTMAQLKQWHDTLAETMEVIRRAKALGMTQEEMKEKRILQQWESMGSFFITENRWIDTLYPFM